LAFQNARMLRIYWSVEIDSGLRETFACSGSRHWGTALDAVPAIIL